MSEHLPELPSGAFGRVDETDDLDFYAPPRLVTHIDEGATAALTAFYGAMLPVDGVIFDMMSSWISHLPPDLGTTEVIGHGMNAEELAANRRLDRWFIQDLNADPILPLETASVDAALCCVGVQYLRRPVEVFSDVRRALRPGGPLIVSFSNRCFPTKAVAIWRGLSSAGHARLVSLYLERAGLVEVRADVVADGRSGDPLTAVTGRA
jgi:SAM-dependent methyltransferase